jgi:cytochrome c-type biogenesis protein CcmF
VLRSEHTLDSLFSREAAFLLNNVVLVGLCFVIFWGTFFPLISKAVTGTSAAVGPLWFDRYTVPLALILVLLSGIGPAIAWRRGTLANIRRNFLVPLSAAAAMAIAAYTVVPISSSIGVVLLFCAAAFVFASVGQEFWRGWRARRATSSESPPVALASMVRRNRRRYGGYIVHLGIAVLFIGVAASATFQHEQTLSLQRGQSVAVGAYTMKYVKATGSVVNDPNHTGATMTLGAVLRVTRNGRYVGTLRPSAGYFPASPIVPGLVVASLISGDAVDQIGLKSSWRRDLWAAIKPLGTTLPANGTQLPEESLVNTADGLIPTSESGPQQLSLGYYLLRAIVAHYVAYPPPASFTLIASPLVMWIWIGGLIVLLGGLTAIWPAPSTLRSRVRARYLARVAQELGRA